MSELNQEEEVSNPYNMNKAWHTPDGPKSDTADGMFFERPKQQATSEEAPDAVENEQAPKKRTNYKKRYDDLKRHYDQKLSEFKQKEQELTAMAKNAQPQYEAPRTPEQLEKFKTEYPDLYDTVESVAYLRSSEQVNQLQEQLQMIQQREATALKREAEADLISRHPDFEDIRGSDSFHKWADDQPEQIQDWIYKNPDNAMLASKAIDLFKLETGLSTQTKSQPRKPQGSAADMVSTKTTTVDAQQPRIWTEREIAAMSLDTFDKYEAEINLAVTEGRVVK
jgi:hypothetical protein|tara:strand:- start:520 stop:1362 length:843 start_codon:yes stop_codon:yes gene_type:complete